MSQDKSIRKDVNVPTKMRDGAMLYADVYHPVSGDKHPVLLARTPYSKSYLPEMMASVMDIERIIRAGYAVVVQDIRGSGASPGEFRRYSTELNDSYDSIEWVAVQPWCDGNVGMCGGSAL
jgi:putative CocE/NonD family hydrolase